MINTTSPQLSCVQSLESSYMNGITREGRIYNQHVKHGSLWRVAKMIQALALTVLTCGLGFIFTKSRAYIVNLYRQAYTGIENKEKGGELAQIHSSQNLVPAKTANLTSKPQEISPDALASAANQALKAELEKNLLILADKYVLFKNAELVDIPQNCSISLRETLEKLCKECPNLKVISFKCPDINISQITSNSTTYIHLKNTLSALLEDSVHLQRLQIQILNPSVNLFQFLNVDQIVRLDSILIKQDIKVAQCLFEDFIQRCIKFTQADSEMFDNLLRVFSKMPLESLQVHIKTIAFHEKLPFHRKSTALAVLTSEQLKSFMPTTTDQELLGHILKRGPIDQETKEGKVRFVIAVTRLLELINSDGKAIYEFYKRFGSASGKIIISLMSLDQLKLLRQAMNKLSADFKQITFKIVSQLLSLDREDKLAALSYFITSLSDAEQEQAALQNQQCKVDKVKQEIYIAMYLCQIRNCLSDKPSDLAKNELVSILRKIKGLSLPEKQLFAGQLAKICDPFQIPAILESFVKVDSKDVLVIYFIREILKSDYLDTINLTFQSFWSLFSQLDETDLNVLSLIFSVISEKAVLKVLNIILQPKHCNLYFAKFLFSLPMDKQNYLLKHGLNEIKEKDSKVIHNAIYCHQYIKCLSNANATELTSILNQIDSVVSNEVEKFGKYLAGKIIQGDIPTSNISLILESFANTSHKQNLMLNFMKIILESNEKLVFTTIPIFWCFFENLSEESSGYLESFFKLIPPKFMQEVKIHFIDPKLRLSFVKKYIEIKNKIITKSAELNGRSVNPVNLV